MGTKIENGVATLNFSGQKFLYVTAEGGQFPPPKMRYNEFSFRPKQGENGIIVTFYEAMGNFQFYQYWWEKNKLIVVNRVKETKHPYSVCGDLGFVVAHNEWFYVTKPPTAAHEDHNYRVVDLREMLKYLEGKISIDDLRRNASSHERRKRHVVRMKGLQQEVESFKVQLDHTSGKLSDLEGLQQRTLSRYTAMCNAINKMDMLAELLKKIPERFRPTSVVEFLAGMKDVSEPRKSP